MARTKGGARRASPFSGKSADQVLRVHLAEQLAVIVKNEPRTTKGSVDGLHDIRVALRRMRNLAETFEKLDPDFLGRLDRRVSRLCDRMGDARDLDVWIDLFQSLMAESGWAEMTLRERRTALMLLRRERKLLAADALSSEDFRRTKEMTRDYLRQRRPPRRKPVPPPEVFVSRRMLALRGLIEGRYRQVGNFSKGPAHDLRRAARRLRYLSEFFGEQMGPICVRAGGWITKAQAALGKVHDCDSALEFSRDLPTGKARAAVRRALKKRRVTQLRRFKTAWRQYAGRRLQKDWLSKLEASAK